VSDSKGTILAEGGLDVAALLAHKGRGEPVASFPGGRPADPAAISRSLARSGSRLLGRT